MAEENNQEVEKKSPIKLILMIVGGIVLLGVGLGIGLFVEEMNHQTLLQKSLKLLRKRKPRGK